MSKPIQHLQLGFPPCISLSITFNDHANYYQSAAAWVVEQEDGGSSFDWVSTEERQKAMDTNSIWVCQWYPRTPIGFYSLAASSFAVLMPAVLAMSKEDK